jgi:hypothetical protein
MHPMERARRGTRFAGWVSSVGVSWVLDGLREQGTPVAHQTVYRWLSGSRVPTLIHAASLVTLSGGTVTVQDLVNHGKEVRGGGNRRT